MPVLSPKEIAKVNFEAGFYQGDDKHSSIELLTLATAICLAESGGDTDATGTNTNGSIDRGLWQFNSKSPPTSIDDQCAYDPACASKKAQEVYFARSNRGEDGFGPWVAYTSGSYIARMAEARKGVKELGRLEGVVDDLPLPDVSNPISGVVDFIKAIFSASTWIRVALAIVGIVIVIYGFRLLIREVNNGG